MKKLVIRIGLGLIVIALLVVAGMVLSMNAIVKKGVEAFGPQVIKAPVALDSVSLSILSGSGKVSGLIVGNPEGFKSPYAIKAGAVSTAIVPGSLLKEKVLIKSVRLESPEINFEGGLKNNNLNKILANIDEFAAASKSDPKQDSKGGGKKLQVDEFVLTGAKVTITMAVLAGKSATFPMPDIQLKDLGAGPDGITAAELARKVTQEILAGALKTAGGVIGDIGEGAADVIKGTGKAAADGLDKAAKGIGGLFKKDK